ncbi:MAG TPA: chromate transporter [Firmicutes bacterium]|nr:chromate transporter [Candidatus Fermentithermobacillaceae bacterium]
MRKKWPPFRRLVEIVVAFTKMGFMTLGGGFAMIPLITEELVEKKQWLEQEKLLEIIAVAQALPGSLSINLSVLVGYEVADVAGAVAAVVGAAFPPFATISLVAAFFSMFQDNPVTDAAFKGIRCAVVALIWNAGVGMAKTTVKDPFSLFIFAFTMVVMMVTSLNPAVLIAFLAMLGVGAMAVRSWRERRACSQVGGRKEGQDGSF